MDKKKVAMIIFFVFLTFLLSLIFISAYDQPMIVEANFVGYGEQFINIIVPDYIYLGKVDKDNPISSLEPLIRINNTGNVNVIVTPELASGSPAVFNYTYFRKQKTSTTNPSLNVSHQIGEYNISIKKMDDETFYMRLNLTDFEGILPSDNLNLSATIKFIAMAS